MKPLYNLNNMSSYKKPKRESKVFGFVCISMDGCLIFYYQTKSSGPYSYFHDIMVVRLLYVLLIFYGHICIRPEGDSK